MKADPEPVMAPVSVVIPCYRCTSTIDRALNSVLGQTVVPAEIILVDDGSGDGTLEYLQALAVKHGPDRIRTVALSQNQGAASARNAGWDIAGQPYLAFLDSDDAWHPRKIEIQHKYMVAHPDVSLCAHLRRILVSDEIPADNVGEASSRRVSKLRLLLSNKFFAPTVMMLKRELPYRFLQGRRHVDDHLLWLQLVCTGHLFVRLSARLAFTYKAPYGQNGLSSQIWRMEQAELSNYWILHRSGCIGVAGAIGLSFYSLVKFLRRAVLVSARRMAR